MQIPQGFTKSDEIRNQRTVNAKRYLMSNIDNVRTYKTCAGVGHQHYMNKLGLGDGEVRWREIDWALQWDDARRGWYFNFHSFNPFLPEYADDWVEFRDLYDGKDQTTKFKAQCSHVLGRLLPSLAGVTDMNCVIYDDAFGTGIDYILYFTRTCLKKVVRIREGYYTNAEQRFKFEINLPNTKVVRATDKYSAGYELDTSLNKTFDTAKQTLVGNDMGDGKEWYTYLRDFKAWDDNQEITISVDYSVTGSQKFIEKIIPASFLNSATGDVFTDTTASYFAASGDGRTWKAGINETWAALIVGGGTGKQDNVSATWSNFNQASLTTNLWGNNGHNFYPIDTSGIPDAEEVTAATLKLYYNGTSGDSLGIANNDNSKSVLIEGGQASTSGLANSDHQGMGSVDFGRSPRQATIVSAGAGYFDIALNTSGLSFINKTGFSKLGTKIAADFDAVAPAWVSQGWTAIQVYFAEQGGTAQDPFIEVVSSVTSAFTPRIMMY